MKGHYYMSRVLVDSEFEVDIPEFQLIVPYKLN